MDKVSGRLTVFFEEPFWIGVFEHIGEEIVCMQGYIWCGTERLRDI